jgi:hypothetical protein
VIVRNRRLGSSVTGPVLDGGVDPLAVPALAGDELDVEVVGADGKSLATVAARVPVFRGPVVVRTDPGANKRDVPLNAVISVVFSEPVDSATLAKGITLRLQGNVVPVRIGFVDGSDSEIEVVPTEPLLPLTDYQLIVDGAVLDLDGDPLADPVTISFTTGTAASPALTLSVPATANAVQGRSATLPVGIGRNNVSGPVTLAIRSAPVGMTATFAPRSTMAGASVLTVDVDWSVAPGVYRLAVRGAADRVSGRASFSLTVAPRSSSTSIDLDFSACGPYDWPEWFAFQDGIDGRWTRVTGRWPGFHFVVADSKVGIAYRTPTIPTEKDGDLVVGYYSAAELQQRDVAAYCRSFPGPAPVSVEARRLSPNQRALISMGGGSGQATVDSSVVVLYGDAGVHDLLGYARDPGTPGVGDRVFLARDVDQAQPGGVGPVVDFRGAESADPAAALMALANPIGGETLDYSMGYQTGADCSVGGLYGLWVGPAVPIAGTSFSVYGVPAALQRPTDRHVLQVFGSHGDGLFSLATRSLQEVFFAIAPRTVTLPDPIPAFTPTVVPGGYLRLRFRYVLPAEYDQEVSIGFDQDGSGLTMTATVHGYLGGTVVDLTVPDFSAVPGWDHRVHDRATGRPINWRVQAIGGGRTGPCAGARTVTATRVGTI